jgi:hypothetical protein
MNYLSHGARFIENPWFLAGTALPDWLSVANRNVRVRPRQLDSISSAELPEEFKDFISGIKQHFQDDDLFHQSRAFYEVTSQVTQLFKQTLGSDDGFRPSFLGHIVTELLLDRWLMLEHEGLLLAYYESLNEIDPVLLEEFILDLTHKRADNLASFIGIFREIRFLHDYEDFSLLLARLNQVLKRVKLPMLDRKCEQILVEGYQFVENSAPALLSFAMPSFIVK